MSGSESGLPTVVQFGAGAIGRGFVGQLWAEADYEVVFVDVDETLVAALNARRAYPLRLVAPNGQVDERTVAPVRAVLASDREAVAHELARCAFACTAVGVHVFAHLAPTLAAGIAARARFAEQHVFNVLCCENQNQAGALLRAAVRAALPPNDPATVAYLEKQTGFVDASVGRMVPVQTAETRARDPLLVVAEPYAELPIDAVAWLGPVPEVAGLSARPNFGGYVARKLFTHNGGHALLAYLGAERGHTFIWQAAGDPELVAGLRGFWDETGTALVRAFGFDPAEQRAHEDDLLRRFQNRALGDTVARVARDPARKLRGDDRLVGAALLCLAQNVPPVNVCHAIAAALRYKGEADDPSAGRVREEVTREGVFGALTVLSGLPTDSPLVPLVAAAYNSPSPPSPPREGGVSGRLLICFARWLFGKDRERSR